MELGDLPFLEKEQADIHTVAILAIMELGDLLNYFIKFPWVNIIVAILAIMELGDLRYFSTPDRLP